MTTSLDMIRGRSNVVTLTNNSGGALVAGDVCVQDTSADEKVTTTTSAASVLKVFVAAEAIASGAAGRFYESGYCPLVNVNASVTRGRFLFTHTVAKQAAENATYGAGAFGKILKSGTTPSAIIYSATAQAAGAGTIGGATGSTDNAVIRADGTGGVTIQSSLITVDDSGTVNIPTGQTYNINNVAHTHSRTIQVALNGATALTTSDKGYFRIPAILNGFNLTAVAAMCVGASSSGTPTFTVKNGATSMLSTNITIDQSETDTSTAGTAAVIDTAEDDVATGDHIEVACTVAGTGTTYVVVELTFTLP